MFRLMQDFCLQSLNPYTIYQVFTYVGQLTWSILRSLIKFRKLSISFGFFHDNLHFSRYLSVLIIRRTLRSGLCRTSTSLPSWISIFLILVLRLLIFISDICSINTKAMDENQDARNDFYDGIEGLKDPERRGRRRSGSSDYDIG